MSRFRESDWQPLAVGAILGLMIYVLSGHSFAAESDIVNDDPHAQQLFDDWVNEPETQPVKTFDGWVDMSDEERYWFFLGTQTGWKNSQRDFLQRCLDTNFKIIEFPHRKSVVEIMCFERR